MDGYRFSLGQRIVMSARLAIEAEVQTVLDRVDRNRRDVIGGADVHDEPLAAIGISAKLPYMSHAIKQSQKNVRPA